MPQEIVQLGARCDLVSDDGEGHLSFAVVEFALLADGRRIEIDHRGWDSWLVACGAADAGPKQRPDPWEELTVAQLERDVRNVVLPDDDETAAAHEHDWRHLAEQAAAQGVRTTPEQLAQLPYVIELSDLLLARVDRGQT